MMDLISILLLLGAYVGSSSSCRVSAVHGRCLGSAPNRSVTFMRSRTTSGAACACSRTDRAMA
jgi:hypothetical protein